MILRKNRLVATLYCLILLTKEMKVKSMESGQHPCLCQHSLAEFMLAPPAQLEDAKAVIANLLHKLELKGVPRSLKTHEGYDKDVKYLFWIHEGILVDYTR